MPWPTELKRGGLASGGKIISGSLQRKRAKDQCFFEGQWFGNLPCFSHLYFFGTALISGVKQRESCHQRRRHRRHRRHCRKQSNIGKKKGRCKLQNVSHDKKKVNKVMTRGELPFVSSSPVSLSSSLLSYPY
jgi:hypothetical protein